MLIGGDEWGRMLEIGVAPQKASSSSSTPCPPARVLEVMSMPRSIQEILDYADELAKSFEDYDPARAIRCRSRCLLRRAALTRARSEREVIHAAAPARSAASPGTRAVRSSERRLKPLSSDTRRSSSKPKPAPDAPVRAAAATPKVSPRLTSPVPQPATKAPKGPESPWSRRFERLFRNGEVAGSNPASSTGHPVQGLSRKARWIVDKCVGLVSRQLHLIRLCGSYRIPPSSLSLARPISEAASTRAMPLATSGSLARSAGIRDR